MASITKCSLMESLFARPTIFTKPLRMSRNTWIRNGAEKLMGYFECCKGCVAPKRHVGCHSTCKEYLDDKAAYDEEQANIRKERKNVTTNKTKRLAGINAEKTRLYKIHN